MTIPSDLRQLKPGLNGSTVFWPSGVTDRQVDKWHGWLLDESDLTEMNGYKNGWSYWRSTFLSHLYLRVVLQLEQTVSNKGKSTELWLPIIIGWLLLLLVSIVIVVIIMVATCNPHNWLPISGLQVAWQTSSWGWPINRLIAAGCLQGHWSLP